MKMNYKIIKQGRWGRIEPIPQGKLCAMLNKKMMYAKQGIMFMQNKQWGIVRLYKKDKGMFPYGFIALVVNIFEEWQKYNGDSFEVVDDTKYSEWNGVWFDVQLRDYQRDAVRALYDNHGGIVCCPTGSGKSRIAIEFIRKMNVLTLIIVTTLEIKSMWERIIRDCNATIVVTYQSIKSKEWLKNFKMVVCDEVHHSPSKSIYNIIMNSPNAIIVGLSATPNRTDGNEMKIEAAVGRIVYEIKRKELINRGYLTPAKVFYHYVKPDTYEYYENYHDAYEQYIVDNDERNDKIVKIALAETSVTLILVNQIRHGDILLKKFGNDKKVVFVNGQHSKKERDRLNGEILSRKWSIVIATTIYDEGIDIKVFNAVILAGSGKSFIKVTQRVGRVLRIDKDKKFAIVHDFKDDCVHLDEHYRLRRKTLEEDFEVIDYD